MDFINSCVIIYILLLTKTLTSATIINPEDLNNTTQLLQKIPDLYKMDDFYKCPEPASFCNGVMKLVPHDPDSDIWKLLEDLSRTRFRLNRTILVRAMCIPTKFEDDTAKKLFIVNKSDEELKPYNLSSKIFRFGCMKPRNFYKINNKSYYLIIMGAYFFLMLVATFYDETLYNRSNPSTYGKWLVCFSLTSFNKSTITKTDDYKKLKCMQGIRTYQTILVIFGHIVLNLNQKHIKNDEYVERMFSKNICQFSLVSGMWILQTYFLMSTWLITYQVLSLYEKTGQFTIRNALLLFIHRVFRIWPTFLVMLFIVMPIFYSSSYGPGNYELLDLTFNACSNNWWVTLLFATNFLSNIETCHSGMWSLTMDTQYYALTIIFLYVVLNQKINIKKGLAVLFITSYIANLIQAHYFELSMGSLINVKHSTHLNLFLDDKVAYTYYGFWVNSGASIVGVLFGYLYFCHNNKKVQRYERLYCNCIVFLIVPVLAILAGCRDYSQWISTVVGPLFRPMFTIGIGTGIYGISRNIINGIFKNVCEYKYAVVLGNFTFSTYVFHFGVVFRRGYLNSKTIELDMYTYLWPLLQDIPASFMLGIIATLMVELPGLKIKNLILPRIMPKSDDLVKINDDCKNKQD